METPICACFVPTREPASQAGPPARPGPQPGQARRQSRDLGRRHSGRTRTAHVLAAPVTAKISMKWCGHTTLRHAHMPTCPPMLHYDDIWRSERFEDSRERHSPHRGLLFHDRNDSCLQCGRPPRGDSFQAMSRRALLAYRLVPSGRRSRDRPLVLPARQRPPHRIFMPSAKLCRGFQRSPFSVPVRSFTHSRD